MKKVPIDTEISNHQRLYRESANRKLLTHSEIKSRILLDKTISRGEHEIEEYSCWIKVAENKANKIENNRMVKTLEGFLAEGKIIDEDINNIKVHINHLKSQILRVDEEYNNAGKLMISDLVHAENVRSAYKAVEILENELDFIKKKKNRLKLQNSKLRHAIDELRYTRCLFKNQWENVVNRLTRNKKNLIDMVEQVLFAFARGTDFCKRIEFIKSKTDNSLFYTQMQNVNQSLEAEERATQFFQSKMNAIAVQDNNRCLFKGRADKKTMYQKMTDVYSKNIDNIKKLTNLNDIDGIIANCTEHKRSVFSSYLYLNELNQSIDTAGSVLLDVQKSAALAERKIEKPHKKQNRVEIEKSVLTNQQSLNHQLKEREESIRENLDRYYSAIHKMYEMFKTRAIPHLNDGCLNDLELNATETNEYNVEKILSTIEERLKFVMWNLYCWQHDHADGGIVNGIEFVNYKKMETPMEKLVHPCPECSQNEDAAKPEKETLLDRGKVIEKLKKQIKSTQMESRMHNIEECPTATSRNLLATLYPTLLDGNKES